MITLSLFLSWDLHGALPVGVGRRNVVRQSAVRDLAINSLFFPTFSLCCVSSENSAVKAETPFEDRTSSKEPMRSDNWCLAMWPLDLDEFPVRSVPKGVSHNTKQVQTNDEYN